MATRGRIIPPLINLKKLPDNCVSGVSADELDVITRLSSLDDDCEELISGFIAFLEEDMDQSISLGDYEAQLGDGNLSAELADLDRVELEGLPTSTRRQMEENGRRFFEFCMSKGLRTDYQDLDDGALNEYLRLYYFQLGTKEGKYYAPSSLGCIRAGIQRYLNILCKRPTNLMAKHTAFDGSNRMLCYKIKQFIEAGQETRNYDAIEEGDMCKIRDYFDRRDAERLQDETLFRILYELGERGQEHLRALMGRNCLQHGVDADGRKYLALPPLPSKNRSADVDHPEKSVEGKYARIYNTELIYTYMSHLPQAANSFFPKPLQGQHGKPFRFSDKTARGYRYLQEFMKNLSAKARLSKVYTNHCIRVTRVCDLEAAGHTLQDIMLITGHKCEKTVKRYLIRRRDRSLFKSSEAVNCALSRHLPSTSGMPSNEAPLSANASESIEATKICTQVMTITSRDAALTSIDGLVPRPVLIEACPTKKMRVSIDGSKNLINIVFE